MEGRHGIWHGLFKRTKERIKALDGISFEIGEGELVGYIGPNGAGKSTTVKVMSGILTPDGGTCSILGRTPWKERVAHVANIGVVFGQRSQLWWDLPVVDSFNLLRDIYKIRQTDYISRLDELVGALDIAGLLQTPVRQLSLGQRMRCEITASMLHRPKILFLDEPTIGLDAVSKLALRDFLKRENKKNAVTMILTTHDMDDIEALCGRVMVIGNGRLLYDGGLDELKRRYATLRRMKIISPNLPGGIAISGAESVHAEGNACVILFDPQKHPSYVMMERVIAFMREKSAAVTDIVIQEQDIDEIISAMYRELRL
jgi:ABC-2 type transport system ATP-binding protein